MSRASTPSSRCSPSPRVRRWPSAFPEVSAVFETVRTQLPQVRVVDFASTGDPLFVSEDGRTTFALVQGPLPTGFGPGAEVQLGPVFGLAKVLRVAPSPRAPASAPQPVPELVTTSGARQPVTSQGVHQGDDQR